MRAVPESAARFREAASDYPGDGYPDVEVVFAGLAGLQGDGVSNLVAEARVSRDETQHGLGHCDDDEIGGDTSGVCRVRVR